MTTVSMTDNTLSWRISELERRINAVAPEATIVRLDAVEKDLKIVKRLLWTLILTVIGATISVTFALLQGSAGVG